MSENANFAPADATPGAIPIPVARSDTRALPRSIAMQVWQEQISTLFDSRPRRSVEDGFFACVEVYFLEHYALGRGTCNSMQDFDRSPRKLARDGMDGYLLQFYEAGRSEPRVGGGCEAAGAGDLYVIDLAQPLATTASAYANLNLLVPRQMLAPHLRHPDACHEAVLPARRPLVTLFRDALTSFYSQLDAMTLDQGQAALRPLLDLAAVAVNERICESQVESVNLARLTAIHRYVEAMLLDPGLRVETVAAQFGLSRRSLYRAFAPFDGFAAYVKERRLRRARQALLSPASRHLSIAEIALRHGFTNPEHFTRAFRTLFGMTPREVRHVVRHDTARATGSGTSSWTQWISHVGRDAK